MTAIPPGEDAGSPAGPTPTAEPATLTGLHTETEYHYRFVATNGLGTTYGADQTFRTTGAVGELVTEEPTELDGKTATLHGSFNPEPLDTHYYFSYSYYYCEWSEAKEPVLQTCYGGPTDEAPVGGADAGIPHGPTKVSLPVAGLEPDAEYNVSIVASNSLGTSVGATKSFKTPPAPPEFRNVATAEVHTDVATVAAEIYPGESNATNFNEPGAKHTEYYFEYGPSNCATSKCLSTPKVTMGRGTTFESVTGDLENLTPGTTYHWRAAAVNTNSATPTFGPDETFTTFPYVELGHDSCPNAHQRQQTGAAGLLDCRAYERVSSPNAGGYDVESDLVSGQTPFGGFPEAEGPSRVLYAVHDGGISGTGHPTNDGPDPYVATRTANGWTTEYVGIPSNIDPASDPFSSTLAEATPNLETFAFSGEHLCAPCFSEGIQTGIPLHLPNGSLVQGMAGSINPGPEAKPDGHIAKYFSANGSHFIFGSSSQFEPDANKDGDVSIYDRDLTSGQTHVVSKTPSGENLPCLQGAGNCHSPADPNGIAELDISRDGSRIIVAQKVSEDADHNVYYHPYMDIGDSSKTIDLAPGSTSGVLYDGMSEDGSKVFFTTKDKLLAADTDESADLYGAEVSPEGKLNLQLLSTGAEGTGNSNSCDPVSNEAGAHWNSLEATPNCGILAIGGGGGLATGDGTVYFLSPELLDGPSNGTENQPNLYVVRPGKAPQFVATLAPNDPAVVDGVKEAGTRHTADFQVTPNGEYAVFGTTQQLSEYDNTGHSEIYRYGALNGKLDCVSCKSTGVAPDGPATLASNGLSLTNDGRVFFNSDDALVLRDTDHRQDVYEWEDGTVQLISSGASAFDSSLLSVTASGADVYFFTRDSLAPQDQSGPEVKIYDAREFGGFAYTPPAVPCQASDECHGPGTPAPPLPDVHVNPGTSGNTPSQPRSKCKGGLTSKHSKCVKKHGHKGHRHGGPRHHRGSRRAG